MVEERVLDGRGVRFGSELWEEVSAPLRDGRALLALRLDRVTLPAGASFADVVVENEASFDGAIFSGRVEFVDAELKGPAWFRDAEFREGANFAGCVFGGGVEFRRARFVGTASFVGADFQQGAGNLGGARFHDAVFEGAALFWGATFHARAGFRHVRFLGRAHFAEPRLTVKATVVHVGRRRKKNEPVREHALFRGFTSFDEAVFTRAGASFRGVTFEQPPVFDRARFGVRTRKTEALMRSFHEESGTDFVGAGFPNGVSFARTSFWQDANFTGASFGDEATFSATRFLRRVTFDGARFARATFAGAVFREPATFEGATFERGIGFEAGRFKAAVSFDGGRFMDETSFQGREFRGPALFRAVEFRGPARFTRAVFRRDALFGEILGDYGVTIAPAAAFGASAAFPFVTFEGTSDFTGARFSGATAFEAAVFHNGLVLERAVFDAEVDFADAALAVEAVLRRSRFKDTVRFDRMAVVAETVDLEGASFAQHVALEVDAARVSLRQAQFLGGVTLRAGRGDIAVEETEFSQPSSIAAPAGAPRGARIVSLRGSQVGRLVLSDVDLRACRFEGAHNLAGLRIEGTEAFERAPHRYRSRGRQAIAEEHEWRRDHRGPLQPSGWYPDSCAFPTWLPPPRPREPHQIAATYRDLRKGREESRDEPGAADFYYGEMEMRRHSGGHAPRAERSIVWLYWLVSGYGLRASRALTGLAVTVLVFALLLSSFGFERTEPRRGFGQALIFALESTTSLLRGTDRQLTDAGEVLWIVLRLLGPLFFGLALLSLRGRVKR